MNAEELKEVVHAVAVHDISVATRDVTECVDFVEPSLRVTTSQRSSISYTRFSGHKGLQNLLKLIFWERRARWRVAILLVLSINS